MCLHYVPLQKEKKQKEKKRKGDLYITGCLQTSCKFLRLITHIIFWTFPSVLGFFWPFNMGDFSYWYSRGIELKKKVEKSHPQKKLRVVSNWLNFSWLNFGFGSCQLCIHLSQAFLHHFSKFLCTYCCRFLENWAQ